MREPMRIFRGLAHRALRMCSDTPVIFYAQKRVLALTADSQVRTIAGQAFSKEWTVLFIESLREAQEAVLRWDMGLVLLDWDAPGVDWQMAVHDLSHSPYRACVIGLSRNATRRCWEDVTDLGGYDLLAKPLAVDALLRVARDGWSYWCSQKTIRTERFEPDI